MSDVTENFLTQVLDGSVLAEEIDDYVDEWHDSESLQELHEYLGFTESEYSLWVSDPTYLGIVLAARSQGRPLYEAVNDNYADLTKLAARSNKASDIAKLKAWLEVQEKGGI